MGQVDIRRLWPDVLEQVRTMKRFTWILLRQNAQVVGVEGNILTLGFRNMGARESFVNGGSDQILRQALIDLIGADWRIDAIVDPTTDPERDSAPRVVKPAVEPTPQPASEPSSADRPASPEPHRPPPPADARTRAREAVVPTRPAGQAPEPPAQHDDPDAYVSAEDPTIDDDVSGTELLQRELGAVVIEEIPHDN